MNPRQNVDFLILLVQQVLQALHFRFQRPHPFFQRLRISSRESPSAQLVACFALEAHVRTLSTAGGDAVTSDFLAPTSVTGLCNPTLCTSPNFYDFHGKNPRHGLLFWGETMMSSSQGRVSVRTMRALKLLLSQQRNTIVRVGRVTQDVYKQFVQIARGNNGKAVCGYGGTRHSTLLKVCIM